MGAGVSVAVNVGVIVSCSVGVMDGDELGDAVDVGARVSVAVLDGEGVSVIVGLG